MASLSSKQNPHNTNPDNTNDESIKNLENKNPYIINLDNKNPANKYLTTKPLKTQTPRKLTMIPKILKQKFCGQKQETVVVGWLKLSPVCYLNWCLTSFKHISVCLFVIFVKPVKFGVYREEDWTIYQSDFFLNTQISRYVCK